MQITLETKNCYKKRFWFMKNLADSYGDGFLICSEELAYAFLWELCERIQEELTFINSIENDRLLQIYSLIEKFPFATDEEIKIRANELFGLK